MQGLLARQFYFRQIFLECYQPNAQLSSLGKLILSLNVWLDTSSRSLASCASHANQIANCRSPLKHIQASCQTANLPQSNWFQNNKTVFIVFYPLPNGIANSIRNSRIWNSFQLTLNWKQAAKDQGWNSALSKINSLLQPVFQHA